MKKSLLLCILAFSSLLASATHLRGGFISVKRNSPASRTCSITVTVYTDTDCNGGCVLFGGELDVLDFGDGSSTLVPETASSSTGVAGVGIAKYTISHTYPGSGSYTISYREPNRNAGVLNMDNAVGTTFYTETQINLSVLGTSSSPLLSISPIEVACQGVAFFYNAGAYDPDGDSLSYELVTPFSDRNTVVSNYRNPNILEFYAGLNYNQANEAADGPPTFSINPVDGTLKWDAPGQTGEYNVAFVIKEWRKIENTWINIGFVRLDRQIIVEDCNNARPTLDLPSDICVVAGTTINNSVLGFDSDNHPVKIEAFSEIFNISDATLQPNGLDFSASPTESEFNWNTTCDQVREQPYQVVFKITDQPPFGPRLVTYGTWRIHVIAPSPVVQSANVLPSRYAQLTWDAYECQYASTMQVWRKVEGTNLIPDSCQTGMPEHSNFSLIATVQIKDDLGAPITSFTDTNDGAGLAVGAKYCYRLVAIFPPSNGSRSYVSNEFCIDPISGKAPIITNVSIDKTGDSDGEITIRWTPPLSIDAGQFPGPYEYIVQRVDDAVINVSSKITDTTFTEGLLDTNIKHSYRVLLFSSAFIEPIDTSSVASSSFLELTPQPLKIKLVWGADVPWSNQSESNRRHLIYRGEDGATENDMVLIDSVDVLLNGFTYTDEGHLAPDNSLDPEKTYCYRIQTRGGYGNPAINAPLKNFSEITCAMPLIVGAEDALFPSVQIYPNPVQQFLRIELSDYARLEILVYDQQGKLQVRQFVTGTTDIDVRHFQNGLYYCVIRNGAKPVSSIRIIKN